MLLFLIIGFKFRIVSWYILAGREQVLSWYCCQNGSRGLDLKRRTKQNGSWNTMIGKMDGLTFLQNSYNFKQSIEQPWLFLW